MNSSGIEHPITIRPAAQRVTVRAGGRVVADTRSALELFEAGYPVIRYVPLEDVDQALLRRSDTRTNCPYKGDASYYAIVTDDGEIADAAWTYEHPASGVAPIRGHIAFYPDRVDVSGTDG